MVEIFKKILKETYLEIANDTVNFQDINSKNDIIACVASKFREESLNKLSKEIPEAEVFNKSTEYNEVIKFRITTVDQANRITALASKYDCECGIISGDGKFKINAKSIMGIFSLDLTQQLTMVIKSNNINEVNEIKSAMTSIVDCL